VERRSVAAWCGAWLAGSLWWLSGDLLLRDGDEEGHVGAAELFKELLSGEGLLRWAAETWMGSYGEYPPLYAALTGGWWALFGGQPGEVSVRAVGLFWVALCAVGTAWLTRQARGSWAAALLFVLACPLLNGTGRHFMPETMVAAFTALSAALLLKARGSTGPAWPAAAGLALGLGLLAKQTMAVAALPLFLLALGLKRRLGIVLAAAGAVFLPWLVGQGGQPGYLLQSAAGTGEGGLFAALAAHPASLAWEVLGPWGAGLLAWAAWHAWRSRSPEGRGALLWLSCSLLLFVLIPKKYPRLLLGLVPAAGMLVGLAAGGLRPWQRQAALLPLALWLCLGSLTALPPNPVRNAVDSRCPQIWLRPAHSDDLGLSRVARLARSFPEGTVAVSGGPEIPCGLQTTHAWAYHLEPYLRREGLDLRVVETSPGEDAWRDADIRISWPRGLDGGLLIE
jgi:4-amino-4-deoxy-L-arabinose transferase-like glycosyltransferase